MLHSGKTAVQGGLHQGGRVLGSQFQPGSQSGRVIVRRFLERLSPGLLKLWWRSPA
jgi:hypothetical protein